MQSRPRLWTVALGLLGGALLVVAGGLSFLAHRQEDLHDTLGRGGYALAVLALVIAGYAMVAHAPVWLRLIVMVGLPLLVASVWQLVDQEVDRRIDGWHAPAAMHLGAGLVAVVVALVTAARGSRGEPDGY
jgi:hypothetical protein